MVLLAVWVAACPLAFTDESPTGYRKQPEAIEILKRADKAMSSVHGIEFETRYLGGFTARGRMDSRVLLRRETGVDAVMQTVAHSVRIEVEAYEAPYAQEHYPRRYTLVETDGESLLMDPAARTVHAARGEHRRRLNYGALASGLPPQYLRPDPLRFEIEESIAVGYLGKTTLEGEECHLVWLKFSDESGLGEQMLYFGASDFLLRRVTVMAPETAIPGGGHASNPSLYIDLTLRAVRRLTEMPDSAFDVPLEDFELITLDDGPSVGDLAPDWSLLLPSGGRVTSEELHGSVVVLYFWASWCPTCHRYMPAIQRIHDHFAGSVRVLAVNAFDRDDALAHIRERGYSFEVALRGDELLTEGFGFPGQPAMVVIDRAGRIRYRALARDPGEESVLSLLAELTAR